MLYATIKITNKEGLSYSGISIFIIINTLNLYLRYITTTSILAILINIIIFVLTIKFIFNLDFKKSYIVTAIIYVLSILAEIVSGTTLILLMRDFNFDKPDLIILVIINVFTIVFLYISSNIKVSLKFYQNICKNLTKFSLPTWVYCIILLPIMLYSAFNFIIPLRMDQNAIIFLTIMLAILAVFTSLIIRELKFILLGHELNKMTKYAENYEKVMSRKIKFHHETKNQLLTIKGLIKNNNELAEYVDSILEDYKLETYEEFDNLFSYLPNSPIRSLLIYKLSEIRNKGINYDLSINKKSKNININTHNQKILCKILGTLIDNAVEETSNFKSKDSFIMIDFINDTNQLKIIIANPIKGKLKPKKKKTRGFGLLLAYDLVKEHKRIAIKTEIVNGCYVQNLIYKKK